MKLPWRGIEESWKRLKCARLCDGLVPHHFLVRLLGVQNLSSNAKEYRTRQGKNVSVKREEAYEDSGDGLMIHIIVGTRPEIIKMSPIIHELKRRNMDFKIVHTGQHYDFELSQVFFEELRLPAPDEFLEVGSGRQGYQTAQALMKLETMFLKNRPDLVLVEGDTNTVLAAALAATKLGIEVGHVEAGPRSHDLRMPEEHNRRLTDHLSHLLFAPSEYTKKNLLRENVWGNVYVTGNTAIDACLLYMPVALEKSKVMEEIPWEKFVLATAHRSENVDNPIVLKDFVKIFENCPLPVVFPIHPRTAGRLEEYGLYERLLSSDNVKILPPTGYFDFLVLMKNCEFILTDSGGVQEEVTAPNLRKKVFVLRESTECPEAVKTGFAKVVGTQAEVVLEAMGSCFETDPIPKRESPYGEGNARVRIVSLLSEAI